MWRAADAVHIDLRGLQPPELMMTILQAIESGDVDNALVGHFDQEPILLYPELEDRSWSHELLESHCGSELGPIDTAASAAALRYIVLHRRAALRR